MKRYKTKKQALEELQEIADKVNMERKLPVKIDDTDVLVFTEINGGDPEWGAYAWAHLGASGWVVSDFTARLDSAHGVGVLF